MTPVVDGALIGKETIHKCPDCGDNLYVAVIGLPRNNPKLACIRCEKIWEENYGGG